MSYQGKQLGQQAESLATEYLQKQQLKILQRNRRTKYGEIDILAQDGSTLVIVEVKAKSSQRFGSSLEMITPAKRRKLILLALELQAHFQTPRVRIDVVGVDSAQSTPVIKHYRGVVEYQA